MVNTFKDHIPKLLTIGAMRANNSDFTGAAACRMMA
jgi:hypothetical protein